MLGEFPYETTISGDPGGLVAIICPEGSMGQNHFAYAVNGPPMLAMKVEEVGFYSPYLAP